MSDILPEDLGGLRVLHLQSRDGADSLALARRGAAVVGVDASRPDVLAARTAASAAGLSARFIIADLFDLRHALPEPESFDLVSTTWARSDGIADVAEWARIIAWFLKPGGRLIFTGVPPVDLVVAALVDAGLTIASAVDVGDTAVVVATAGN